MSPSPIVSGGTVRSRRPTIGVSAPRCTGTASAWASVSPCSVNKLADASSPSLTMAEKALRTSVSCISLAMPSSLLRITSSVIGSTFISANEMQLGAQRLLRHRQGGAGRVGEFVHAAGRDAGPGTRGAGASRCADAGSRASVRTGRRGGWARTISGSSITQPTPVARTSPTSRMVWSVRTNGQVTAISAAMTHQPGCRRHGAGFHAYQRDRDLPGRHPHSLAAVRKGDALNTTLIAMLRQNVRLPDV